MRNLVFVCCALASGALIAENAKVDLSRLTPAERKARYERLVMENQGGLLTVKGTPAGSVVVVNAQKKVDVANFDISKQPTCSRIKDVVKFVEGAPATVATAAKMKSDMKADFAIFIVDDSSLPPSLVAAEAKWGIMNVAALGAGMATPEVVRIRARNEFARVFAMVCGGFSSQHQAPLINFVKDVGDLDKCLSDLPVDVGARIVGYLSFCGVKPAQKVTYRRACQEGWAPKPQNEFQQKVWDEVHELPTQPLTIAPEKKPAKK